MTATQSIGGLNTNHLLEGTFWSGWCLLNISQYNQASKDRDALNPLPEGQEKTHLIYEANKKKILGAASVVAGVSMVGAWAEGVQLISLGMFSPILGSMGYGGSALTSLTKCFESIKEFNRGVESFFDAKTSHVKEAIALEQLRNLIKIAFTASIAAWGIFGSAYTLLGTPLLFWAMDTSFLYAFILFFANLAAALLLPKPMYEK